MPGRTRRRRPTTGGACRNGRSRGRRGYARITAAIAALVWFVGAPLVSLAGVPLPSDAQYIVIGTMAALLGLTLAPLTLTIGSPARGRMKAIIQFSGLAICIALIGAGVV